jgi:hypothetical protein
MYSFEDKYSPNEKSMTVSFLWTKKGTRRELKRNYFVRKLCETTSGAENKGVTGGEWRQTTFVWKKLPEE